MENKINLKYTIDIETKDNVSDTEFLKVPLEIISLNGQKPMTVGELRKIDDLCKKIESAKDTLVLEAKDFKYIKKAFMEFQNWNPEQQSRKRVLAIAQKLEDLE